MCLKKGGIDNTIPTGIYIALALADLNNDGKLDVITGGGDSVGSTGVATIRFGNGNGTFTAASDYIMDLGSTSDVQAVDINNDGKLDLITGGIDQAFDGSVSTRLGNGDGTFGAVQRYSAGIPIFLFNTQVLAGDVNGDSKADLIVTSANAGYQPEISVFLGTGSGTFGAPAIIAFPNGTTLTSSALSDVNGDGIFDIVTVGQDASGGRAFITSGLGGGLFGTPTTLGSDINPHFAVALRDINGDGGIDIVTASLSTVGTRLANVTAGGLELGTFTLRTREGALSAMSGLDTTLSTLASRRGDLGALESRLRSSLTTLFTSIENYAAAESRIRDVDVAVVSSTLIRETILQQAGAAILQQANLQPEIVLSLLSG